MSDRLFSPGGPGWRFPVGVLAMLAVAAPACDASTSAGISSGSVPTDSGSAASPAVAAAVTDCAPLARQLKLSALDQMWGAVIEDADKLLACDAGAAQARFSRRTHSVGLKELGSLIVIRYRKKRDGDQPR